MRKKGGEGRGRVQVVEGLEMMVSPLRHSVYQGAVALGLDVEDLVPLVQPVPTQLRP